MNFYRYTLTAALIFVLSSSVFAQDDDDFAPRGGKATVTIITDPPNSDVFLDGQNLGKSPITKRSFHTGPLRLIIMDQNKELINTRFNVWPNKENKYEGKTIMPHGTILITTNPNKCRVLLDGEYADRTDGGPLTLNSVDAGSHTVGVEGCGRIKDVLIEVKGEQTTVVYLDAKTGKSKVTIEAAKPKKADDDDD